MPTGKNLVKKLNFVDFPNDEIEARSDTLGISFGESFEQIKSSINELEKSRNLIFINKSIFIDDGESSLILPRASNFSEDLLDDVERGHENQEDLVPCLVRHPRMGVKVLVEHLSDIVNESKRLTSEYNEGNVVEL
jgi:hypothetical protein